MHKKAIKILGQSSISATYSSIFLSILLKFLRLSTFSYKMGKIKCYKAAFSFL